MPHFSHADAALGQFSSAFIKALGTFRTDLLETRRAEHFGFSIADFFAGFKQQLLQLFRPVATVRLIDALQIPERVSATQTVVAVVQTVPRSRILAASDKVVQL